MSKVKIDYRNMANLMECEILTDTGDVPCYLDTGVLALNWVCSGKFVGGGVPGGCCTEIYGDSSTGKTLFGTNILRGVQTMDGIAIFLDAERSISKDFAVRASHIDPSKLLVIEADSLESAFNRIHKIIKVVRNDAKVPISKPIAIVYDSIAASPSMREFAETTLDMENTTKSQMDAAGAGADKPGERAKICSKELRKLTPVLKENNAAVVFVNQTRNKIGVLFGPQNTGGGGGRALPYYSSCRLEMYAAKQMKDELENTIGVNVRVKNQKNKCTSPFKEAKSLHLFFEKGIDPFGGLLEVLIKVGRIKPATNEKGKTKAGYYKLAKEFSKDEIQFRASKEKNTIPVEILLTHPKLVDAKNSSEVKYYIDMFGIALEASQKDIYKQEAVKNTAQ